ncbi:hypothetical protein X975_16765, partial [Stegodyphus mimosarum]
MSPNPVCTVHRGYSNLYGTAILGLNRFCLIQEYVFPLVQHALHMCMRVFLFPRILGTCFAFLKDNLFGAARNIKHEYQEKLEEIQFLNNLAFLTDLASHLNALNLKQGWYTTGKTGKSQGIQIFQSKSGKDQAP